MSDDKPAVILARKLVLAGDGKIEGPALVVTGEAERLDPVQHVPIQHVSIGHDGRLTPRVDPDARPPASVDVVVHGEPGEATEIPPGIEWRKPCEDCDGTGWASETNPGTGGGTGRDEQIAVECPRGCPEPTDDKPFHECGQQVVDAATRIGEPGHDPSADWWCPACNAYLGDQEIGHHDPADVARWLEQRSDPLCAPLTDDERDRLLADYDPHPTTAEIAAAIARGEMTLGLPHVQDPVLAHVTDGDLLRAIREETADTGEGAALECEEATRRGLLTWEDGEEGESDAGVLTPKGWAALAANDEPAPLGATPAAAQGVDDEQGEDPRW